MNDDRLTGAMITTISRYIRYGWKWALITKIINRYFNTRYTAVELGEHINQQRKT